MRKPLALSLSHSAWLRLPRRSAPSRATPESVGMSTTRLGAHARGDAGARRHAPGRRHRDAGRARREDGGSPGIRIPGRRREDADEDRQPLPHRVDDQADHQRRCHDAVRGGQARAHRSGVAIHSCLPRHEGADAWRTGNGADARAGAAPDHHPRSAHPSIRSDLRIHRQRARWATRIATGGVNDGLTVVEVPLAENIDRLAKAPLVSQPGAEWHYSLSTDVLGRVVEVASGMPFDAFLSERIFKPLHMADTELRRARCRSGRAS